MFFEEKLKEKLCRYYDITASERIGGFGADFVARYHQRNVNYVLKKSNELYAFENNEFIVYKRLEEPFSEKTLEAVDHFFKNDSRELLSGDDDHMSSAVTVVIETELPEDPDLIKRIQKYVYYKSFMFGLKGWVNGGLMLINPSGQRGLSNKYSRKELKKFLI
jgi:hypothetical protein